ncbi:MAG: glycosyltransferase family 39 protein, partial [Chloroflexota bacterium]
MLAFAVSSHSLGRQSFWPDEAYSWDLASRPAGDIIHTVIADHVPGYFLLLHVWMQLTGQSQYALRFLSLIFGVLVVALLISLSRALLGPGPASLAGLLAVANPFLAYYSQETRMYSLLLALALLTARLLVSLCRRRAGPLGWGAYSLLIAGGLYVHYYAVLLVPALAIGPLLLGRAKADAFRRAAAAMVAAGVLFSPWALTRLNVFNGFIPVTAGTLTLGRLLTDYAVAVHAGEATYEIRRLLARQPLPWAFVGLCLLTVAWGVWKGPGRARARWFLVLLALLPLATVAALSLGRRDFTPRYAIVALAGYVPLLAAGLWSLRPSPLRWFIGLTIFASFGWCLHLYFSDPRFQRQDFRSAIHYAAAGMTNRDLAVLVTNFVAPIWRYYAPPALPALAFPYPTPLRSREVGQLLQRTALRRQRVQFVVWQEFGQDPQHHVRRWLDSHLSRVAGRPFGEVTVYSYASQPTFSSRLPSRLVSVQAVFSGEIELVGYRESRLSYNGVRLELAWKRLRPLSADFHIFVHLVDATGRNLAISDHRPGFDTVNLTHWQGHRFLIDQYDLTLSQAASKPVEQTHLELG